MSAITTHVLDVALGRPAEGIDVHLEQLDGAAWKSVARGRTDADGRVRDLLAKGTPLAHGTWRITFATGPYLERTAEGGFYPEVSVVFVVRDARHHHVPLLLSPYGYSTYRGS